MDTTPKTRDCVPRCGRRVRPVTRGVVCTCMLSSGYYQRCSERPREAPSEMSRQKRKRLPCRICHTTFFRPTLDLTPLSDDTRTTHEHRRHSPTRAHTRSCARTGSRCPTGRGPPERPAQHRSSLEFPSRSEISACVFVHSCRGPANACVS